MTARRTTRPAGLAWCLSAALAVAACGASSTRTDVPGGAPATSAPLDDERSTEDDFSPDDANSAGGQPVDPTQRPSTSPAPSTTAPPTTPTTTAAPPAPSTTELLDTPPPTDASPPPTTTVDLAVTPTPPPTGDPAAAGAPTPIQPSRAPADPSYAATTAAFRRLANNNAGASLSVATAGEIVYSNASGTTIDGAGATSDSPMVVASVSKLVVAIGISRLQRLGLVDIMAPVPWADMGLDPDAAWGDVTVRELLDHRGGVPKARSSWFSGEGTCGQYIPFLLVGPPREHRGQWVYSNGNYCLLGLLIEERTGLPLDAALQQLVFDPVGVDGVHLTDSGLQPGDLPHGPGVARLSRLGGAGTLVISTDDIALLVGQPTATDRWVLLPPGVFTDQYGFGHTGTVEGAKSCVWVLDGGATVVAATIAGDSYSSGGRVCDLVVPAIATDIGINQGEPDRTP